MNLFLKRLATILSLLCIMGVSYASEHGHEEHHDDEQEEHHDHDGGKAIGHGKAIEEVDTIKGFKLSKEAISSLDIKFQTIERKPFSIQKSTLVAAKSIKGIYRYREGYFKFIKVHFENEVENKYIIDDQEIKLGDQIVVEGVGLLRVADIYSTDSSEYGHSH